MLASPTPFARIALDELEHRGHGTALANFCIDAGMGTATIIERL